MFNEIDCWDFVVRSHGPLTVRSLLDTREEWMEGFQFTDPYLKVEVKAQSIIILMSSTKIDIIIF